MVHFKENCNKFQKYQRNEPEDCEAAPAVAKDQQQPPAASRLWKSGMHSGLVCLFLFALFVDSDAAPVNEAGTMQVFLHNNMMASETNLEWQHPCTSGVFSSQGIVLPDIFYLDLLRRIASFEYGNLQNSRIGGIDISDIGSWALVADRYNFLPHVARNGGVHLKQWHTSLQIFVGAFAYLERAEYDYELNYEHRTPSSKTLQELDEKLRSSRNMLCEVETAIKNIHPHYQFHTFTRAEMNKKLNFHVKPGVSMHRALLDFMFAKQNYQHFIKGMSTELLKDITRYVKERRPNYESISIVSESESSDESGNH